MSTAVAIMNLVDSILVDAETAIPHREFYEVTQFRKEFQTVKIQVPRQFGTTRAATALIDKYPCSVYIGRLNDVRDIQNRRPELAKQTFTPMSALSNDDDDDREMRTLAKLGGTSLVIIDGVHLDQTEWIQRLFNEYDPKIMVMLGN